MTVGKGTRAGELLRGLIEEIEGVRTRKAQLSESEKEIFQRGKAEGFDTKALRRVLKLRALDPAKRQAEETLVETYMHALGGLDDPPPAYAALAAAKHDFASREAAVEFLKSIVPPGAEIVLKLGGVPIRVYCDADGEPQAEEVSEAKPSVKPLKDEFAAPLPAESGEDRAKDRIKATADRIEEIAAAKRGAAPA